jgi:hypothetical protein
MNPHRWLAVMLVMLENRIVLRVVLAPSVVGTSLNDTTLFDKFAGIEPGAAQFLNARADEPNSPPNVAS